MFAWSDTGYLLIATEGWKPYFKLPIFLADSRKGAGLASEKIMNKTVFILSILSKFQSYPSGIFFTLILDLKQR